MLLRNKRLADALGIRAALGAGAAIGGAKVETRFCWVCDVVLATDGEVQVGFHANVASMSRNYDIPANLAYGLYCGTVTFFQLCLHFLRDLLPEPRELSIHMSVFFSW